MSPHTFLSNVASISSINSLLPPSSPQQEPSSSKTSYSSFQSFVAYVEDVLDNPLPQQNLRLGILSPANDEAGAGLPRSQDLSTMKELVDLAIFRSNTSTSSKRSVNRFEITRGGDRVAVVMLARPAYRLGETIPVAIDFQKSDISCYSLHATLETSEIIDPAIALRSKASIHRVTRRVHASQTESTIFANKVLFNPLIPTTSTPEFITSGINLEWRLRFEFVTRRSGDIDDSAEGVNDVMEEIARDERGIVKAAVQGLSCESFDVTVPLRIYGATGKFEDRNEAGDFSI